MDTEPRKRKLVGITGGIASGKSTVAGLFARLGASIIDADQLARQVTSPGSPAWQELAGQFGGQILNPDGTIDREKLACLVFKDPQARLRLNEITHPRIRDSMLKQAQELFYQGANVVIVEAALIGETPYDPSFDAIILVLIDPARQLERVLVQGKLSLEEAQARMASQVPQERKKAIATYVIDNSGSLKETERQVQAVWAKLIEPASL